MLQQLLMILAGILSLIGAGAISYTYLSHTVGPRDTAPIQVVSTPVTSKEEVSTTPPLASESKDKQVATKTIPDTPIKANGSLVPETPEVAQTVVTPGPLRVETPTSSNPTGLTLQGVISYTNNERAQNGGLRALTENLFLDNSAKMKLDDMFAKQYFEHISPSGVGPGDLAATTGYQYVIVGENLALGNFSGDQGVVTAWMNSPGHRANILNVNFQEIGVAVGRGMYEGKMTWLAVQSFGMPISACPSIDINLKTAITQNNTTIALLKAQLDEKKALIDATSMSDPNYNVYVNQFNAFIPTYNNLVETNRKNVATYNNGVRAFNECIGAVDSSSSTSTH